MYLLRQSRQHRSSPIARTCRTWRKTMHEVGLRDLPGRHAAVHRHGKVSSPWCRHHNAKKPHHGICIDFIKEIQHLRRKRDAYIGRERRKKKEQAREQHNWHIREKAILNRHQINVRDFDRRASGVFQANLTIASITHPFGDCRAHNDLSGFNRVIPVCIRLCK